LLVVYKDHIIAENYSEGFDKSTPILGWSMTKSITSTMYGILSRKGEIDVYEPADVPQWQKDERKNITYNDLLHMNSGLEWIEDYNTMSDVTQMLFQKSDMGAMQASKTLVGKPDSTWNYSSGTTNLLAGPLLKKKFRSQQEYLDFWYRELIDKIGMHSATIENDLSGTYVGSSYGWANTRDWAKFGLLYLNRGNWNGEQIIDSTWVDYVSTPTNTSNGRYGAQFWLNAGGHYPDAPRDLFSANGYQGQYVFIIPSKDLVIVRMGLMEEPEFDVNGLLRDVVSCIR
jgi:CubicO group peptidase (beta-lactamase class C family)